MDHDPLLDDPVVQQYAKDLSKVIILTADEERELFREYHDTGSVEARNKIIESGLRFVVTVAQKYAKDIEHQKHLISAGNEGLLAAIDRFDVSRGTRFLSYATWYVVLFIREELHKHSVIPIPVWRKKSAKKVQDAKSAVFEETGKEATIDELRSRTGLSKNQINSILDNNHVIISLSDTETTNNERGLTDDDSLDGQIINEMGGNFMRTLVDKLPVREGFILQAYYGFIVDPPMSLKQIATILGISSERVRQIKIEALETLKEVLADMDVECPSDVFDWD